MPSRKILPLQRKEESFYIKIPEGQLIWIRFFNSLKFFLKLMKKRLTKHIRMSIITYAV
jgi:hypothetical protein